MCPNEATCIPIVALKPRQVLKTRTKRDLGIGQGLRYEFRVSCVIFHEIHNTYIGLVCVMNFAPAARNFTKL